MLDIAELLLDAVGDLFEGGADAAVDAAGAATDVGRGRRPGPGVEMLDPGAALAPPVDAAASGGRRSCSTTT